MGIAIESDAGQERARAVRMPRIGRRLTWVLLGLELLGTVLLGLGWMWTGDFRESSLAAVLFAWVLFMARTCVFQIGLGLAVILVLLCVLRAWRVVLGLLPGLALCVWANAQVLMPTEAPPIAGESLRAMSFNVLAINREDDQILAQIREQDPDLLVVQECTTRRHDLIVAELGESYPHIQRATWQPWIGISVFSKRELLGGVKALQGHGRPAARFDILVDDRAIAVWAIHPPHPVLPRHVRVGRHQFADLLAQVRQTPGPKMILGDCNWGTTSPQAAVLASEGFADAFSLGGSGRGETYAFRGWRRLVPGFRIDHVYLSEELTCERAWNGLPAGSDHRPVVAEIGWR